MCCCSDKRNSSSEQSKRGRGYQCGGSYSRKIDNTLLGSYTATQEDKKTKTVASRGHGQKS